MSLVSLRPADKLLTLLGIYEVYNLDEKAQHEIELRVLDKYGFPLDSKPVRSNADAGKPHQPFNIRGERKS